MNPYEVDIENLKESREITDGKELLKVKLVSEFLKAIESMESSEVILLTKLDKADLSRLRSFTLSRFTIDRIIGLLDELGFSTEIEVKKRIAG